MSATIHLFPEQPVPLPGVEPRPSSGRIEMYRHSDSTTPNKGGAMVRVTCNTDFAARTEVFVAFTGEVAKIAYAASAACWNDIVQAYPAMGDKLLTVRKALAENVVVTDVVVLKV